MENTKSKQPENLYMSNNGAERERGGEREQKPQQDEDLTHDLGEQKQILQSEQVRYQPTLSRRQPSSVQHMKVCIVSKYMIPKLDHVNLQ